MNLASWIGVVVLAAIPHPDALADRAASRPVSVEGTRAGRTGPQQTADFDTEILPVLTRSGCNAGACHGAAAGRGDFNLSLLGADPAADHEAIVHHFEGRRVDFARPERSLILAKPSGDLDHGGDVVLDQDGPGFQRLLDWIRSGAPRGASRKLVRFEITPRRHRSDDLTEPVPLRAEAEFDDGVVADVTRWTVWTPLDSAAVTIDERSVARVHRRGQHVVTARFLDRVVPVEWIVPFSDSDFDFSLEPRADFIDDAILRTLTELRLPASPPASDSVWLRRVTLDLTGRLPLASVADTFASDGSTDKRASMVESLVSSPAFVDYWTLQMARWLRLHSLTNEPEAAVVYGRWLRSQIALDVGLDRVAEQLLTATGDSHVVGPANFGRMVADSRGHAELVGRFFLGARLGCANCHNHPLDRWTQDDYHGLAAVFAKLERGRIVEYGTRGAVTNPRTGEPAVARIPGVRDLGDDGDARAELSKWLTASENRLFARVTVNRLWRAMFGRGLVEPTDDLRETNPATHPELLEQLADDFVQNGYSLRHTLARIALSHTYARSGTVLEGNAGDDRFYSRAFRRPLPPEVLADAISDVTGVPDLYPGHPRGTRSVSIIDPLTPSRSLDLLGRCSRVAVCDEGAANGGALPAQLHLLNGDLINRKLGDESSQLSRLIAAGKTDAEIVEHHYRQALGHSPTSSQLQRWLGLLAPSESDDRRQRLEDFVWSLLNSRPFKENH